MAKSVLNAPHFQDEAAAFEHVEAILWPNGPVCPHCRNADGAKIGRLQGKTTRMGLRKCYACKKPFTVRMGSIFEDSHLPLHLWLQIIHLMCASKKGVSTRQIQRMLECSMKTAWFLTHRIREVMKDHRGLFTPPIGGAGKTVEVDETYVGRKAGTKAFLPVSEKQPVVALVERNGEVRSFHMPAIRANNLRSTMARNISLESHLMTDESKMYTFIGHNFASHGTVVHSNKEYVRGDVHTNTVEGYRPYLKAASHRLRESPDSSNRARSQRLSQNLGRGNQTKTARRDRFPSASLLSPDGIPCGFVCCRWLSRRI
jgi:transposase-like protein